MADRTDFATAVGALIKGRVPLAPTILAAGTSLDAVTDPGPSLAPTFSVGSTITGKPPWATGNAFAVDTRTGSSGSSPVLFQRFTQGDAFGLREAIRFRFDGVWQEWRDQLPNIPDIQPWYRGSIPSGAHLDDLETGGYYAFTAAAENVLGLPAGTPGGPVTIIRQGASGGHFVFHTATSPMQIWSAHRTGSGWTNPAQFAPGGSDDPAPVADAGLKNQLLVGDYTRRRGGIKWTSTGVVALRFDHGLAKFNQHIRPHLERLNLPYSLALNSQNWGLAENAGVTAEMVNAWVEGGLAEIWNHGQNHVGSKDPEVWTETIVAGLAELRAQIPAASIDGFVVPGTSGVGYGDFITGASIEEFSDTPAGQLLLATHAVVTGAIPNSGNHILDGRIRNGHNHTGFGSSTLESFQSAVTSVASQGYGRVFMMHPSQMETAGYDTEAQFVAKLEWLAAERDAGRVKVVGHYDLPLHALDPATPAQEPYDSGWRDITDSLMFGWTADYAHIRRVGDSVTLRVMRLDGRQSTNVNFLSIPEGFVIRRSFMPVTVATAIRYGRVDAAGLLSLDSAAQAASPATYGPEYTTWSVPGLGTPASLPGDPA